MAEQQIRFNDGAAYERMMGVLEPARGRDLPRLAGAALGLALDRRRLRQRRLHRVARRAMRPHRGARDRSIRGAARLRALAPGGTGGGIPPGQRHGAPLPRRQLRRRRHGAGDLLRSRSGQGCRRDGAGGSPGRQDRGLCLGYSGRRLSAGADEARNAGNGCRDRAAAEPGRIAARSAARSCGAPQGSKKSRRGRSRCGGASTASRITGPPASCPRAWAPQLPPWTLPISRSSRSGCGRACRPMPRAASPAARAQIP